MRFEEGETLKLKVYCNECKGERRHKALKSHKVTFELDTPDGRWEEWGAAHYLIIQCNECDRCRFYYYTYCHDDFDPATNEIDATVEVYPSLNKKDLPSWMHNIGISGMVEILEQAYRAYGNNSYWLASIGLRTAFELFSFDQFKKDLGRFENKVNELELRGTITSSEKTVLNFIIEQGSASVHRGYNPDILAVLTAIEAFERILHRVYVRPVEEQELLAKAHKHAQKIPPR